MQVEPTGKAVKYVREGLKRRSVAELWWAWEALSSATCCRSLVVLHSDVCVLHAGLACPECRPGNAEPGKLCAEVIGRGKATYLGNLILFPGAVRQASDRSCG